jgi:integrase
VDANPSPDQDDVGAVVAALQGPAVPVIRLLEARDLLPAGPGFYCWWSHRGAIADLPHVPHPLEGGLSLLYVGISPARESSRQTVRSRVLGNHLNGNVSSSTFRYVLAALLLDAFEFHPNLRGTKIALRKGALQHVQYGHFDHQRRRLTIFTKGEKVRDLPIPQADFWLDLERLILDDKAEPHHYLLARRKAIPRAGKTVIHQFPDKPMGVHGTHDWWYRCLHRARIVQEGVTSGERMHKARHSAGQRVLDQTGNLKAVQKLLGHESIQTTGDIYTDWDIDQLAETMRGVLDAD